MNDFTKEELEDLIFCVKYHTDYQGDSIQENLINKIQSLIDNYCKHEWREGMCQTCIKCNFLQEY